MKLEDVVLNQYYKVMEDEGDYYVGMKKGAIIFVTDYVSWNPPRVMYIKSGDAGFLTGKSIDPVVLEPLFEEKGVQND